jgi:hypothetical protein
MIDLDTKAEPAPPTTTVDPLTRARKEASWSLIALAIMPTAFAAMGALLPRLLGVTTEARQPTQVLGVTLGFAAAFLALGLWARSRPLPAALLGLALYATFTALNWALGLLLILLAVLLLKSIWTCLRARQL